MPEPTPTTGVTPETTARLPPRWIIRLAWKIHRGLYRVSGGRFGLRRPSSKTYGLMWVETVGRRSGQPRPVMLAYLERGEDLHTLAMNGWGAPEPAWWLNLQADPMVTIRRPDTSDRYRCREAVDEERDELWSRWRVVDTKLDAYARRRPTDTAVVVFEPILNT